MTPPRFHACEAFAAAAALMDDPKRARALQQTGLLEAFPLGPIRHLVFFLAVGGALLEAVGVVEFFEDETLLRHHLRFLVDPRADDDAQRRAFGVPVDLAAIATLAAQLCAALPKAVREDGRALLDAIERADVASPDFARGEAAIALHGHRGGAAA